MVRAATAAGVVVVLSLAFHLLAGGHAPSLRTVAALTALTTVTGLPLVRTRISVGQLLVMLGLAQVALHVGFSTGGHGGHAAPLPMVATHAIATLLTALVLGYGRAVLREGWARMTGRRLPRPAAALPGACLPVPVGHHRPLPSPGADAAMGRAPPLLVRRPST